MNSVSLPAAGARTPSTNASGIDRSALPVLIETGRLAGAGRRRLLSGVRGTEADLPAIEKSGRKPA
jgi:hypothetical protein